jgi:alkyl sulfatase BDS1-like metallo-beta-lactamase superfamily hydrolase
MVVERGPKVNMTSGPGLDTSKGNTTFAIPTKLIPETGQRETIDGLEYEFMLAPDTEAPAEMLFYIPKYKALTVAEDATFTMHNAHSSGGTTSSHRSSRGNMTEEQAIPGPLAGDHPRVRHQPDP